MFKVFQPRYTILHSLMFDALRFSDLHYSYPSQNGVEALSGITFSIVQGEKVALLGLNGAGKTTLLLQTNGLLMPTSGVVEVDGVIVSKKTLSAVRRKVGLVFQNSDDQLFSPTVYEDVAFGPQMMRLSQQEVEHRVREALESVNASHLINRPIATLSGGERRMIAIATVLSMSPILLVFDEPTSYLDLKATNKLIKQLHALPQAMLIATHNLDLALEICDRAILLDKGRLIYEGPTRSVVDRLRLLAENFC